MPEFAGQVVDGRATVSGPSLLDLPYELRQYILAIGLKQKGTIELQHPVWAGQDVFPQPLFQVCRVLRNEALQAFYETNHFLWRLDTSVAHRSDPADYPSMKKSIKGEELNDNTPSSAAALTSALPWQYPHLKKHLRHLNLIVYLPSNLIGDATAGHAWSTEFPRSLERLVGALDRGRGLAELHVFFTAKRFNTRIALAGDQLEALDVLHAMEVQGVVKVQTRSDFKEVKSSILSLDLERRMKASRHHYTRIRD